MKENLITDDSNLYNDIDLIDDENKRYRNFFILLYKDSESYDYNEVLRTLKSFKDYAYIEHKKENDEKKEHTHFFLRVKNNCTIKSLSKKINVPKNYIQKVNSIRTINRYLIHYDDDDKIQYDIDDVICSKSWKRNFLQCFDDRLTEDEILIKIYNYIDDLIIVNNTYQVITKSLIIWCIQNCYDSVYKKYKFEFDNYIKSII